MILLITVTVSFTSNSN